MLLLLMLLLLLLLLREQPSAPRILFDVMMLNILFCFMFMVSAVMSCVTRFAFTCGR